MSNVIPESWQQANLEDLIIRMSNGANVDQLTETTNLPISRIETIWNGNIDPTRVKYIGPQDQEFIDKYSLNKNDILFSHINSDDHIGKTAIYKGIPEQLIHGINLLLIRVHDAIDADFINYQFKHLKDKGAFVAVAQRAVNQSSINQQKLKKFIFNIPPISEQKRIIQKIEELFSEIDNGINSLEMAQGLLKSYKLSIIDKALTGKITEEWRKNNLSKNAKKIEEIIKAERLTEYSNLISNWKSEEAIWKANGKKGSKPVKPDPICEYTSFKDPNLPIEWTCINLGFLANKVRNGISKKPDENPTGCKIFRISAARAHKLDLNDFRMISYTDDLSSFLVQKNDLLFTRYNGTRDFVGVSALFESDENYLYPDKLILVRVNLPSINSKFLEFVTNYGVSRKYLKSKIRTTAGQSGISGSDIKVTPIPLCSLEEQEIIVNFIEDNLDKIEQLYQENEKALLKLLNLKKLILSKAFSGELVPQDPNDEPASVLLERIKAEKEEELTKAKANKAPKKPTKRKTKATKEDEPAQQELI